MTHFFEMQPSDVLFFSDARPMESSDAGQGANWPRPDQLYHALRSAFIANWPRRQDWEGAGEHRFDALRVAGPFPKKGVDLYWPCPLDWGMRIVRIVDEGDRRRTDLPAPLTHAFLSRKEGKVSFPKWIRTEDYDQYIGGKEADEPPPQEPLSDVDRFIGIAMDAGHGTVRDGAFYQAEYLRLREDVSLAFTAECQVRSERGVESDVFAHRDFVRHVAMGGQGRLVAMRDCDSFQFPAFDEVEIKTRYLRWTLLTPAIFLAGWLPGWIDAKTGKVRLRGACESRRPGESRRNWKERCAKEPEIEATLIAARIGKELSFSGWRTTEAARGPKPTVLAVPAGSSYVFDCGDAVRAKELARLLRAPKRRSDLCGEQGFGLGICSSVEVENN